MFASNTSAANGAANYIEDVFSTYLYTGNGSTQTITNGIDLAGKGGLVWTKPRTTTTFNDHILVDSARGDFQIQSNTTAANNAIASFNFASTGYTAPSNTRVNASSVTYASWTFRKQPKFFDVVTYTGDGSSPRTISHNLGSAAGFIAVKPTSQSGSWWCYHRSLGAGKTISLNATDAALTSNNFWGGVEPTSTEFTVQFNNNAAGVTYVAYLFAHNAGGFGLTGTDNVISCGIVNGASAPTVNLGYEPQFVMFKAANTTGNWLVYDNMRGWTANNGSGAGNVQQLLANTSGAETATTSFYTTSTGFAFGGSTVGFDYIYIAIRRGPMKVPTSGTSVFDVDLAGNTTSPAFTSGFPVDFNFLKTRASVDSWYVSDRLRGSYWVEFQNANAELNDPSIRYDYQNGSWNANSLTNYTGWNFRRAPSFFDEVCYTGTGANQTLSHNLQAVPELIIVKNRSGVRDWGTGWASIGWGGRGPALNSNEIAYSSVPTWWNSTAPTSSSFTVGSSATTNGSGSNFVAYLFATCAGVSKVGSYTGTGTTKQIDCGFAGGARFVLIKRTDSTGDWYVWDTARGIVSGNDPYLLLNSTAAEVTSTDYIDTYSAGFEISSTAPAAINASGGTFIFLAIA